MPGKSIITNAGINAFVKASASGYTVKPEYFIVTNDDLTLDPQLTTLTGWRKDQISAYLPIDHNTIEFTINIDLKDASDFGTTFGLFLQDQTLFMLAKPPYPLPPALRQIFKIQLVYQNSKELLDFQYIPYDQVEQDLSRLSLMVSQADFLLKLIFEHQIMTAKFKNLIDKRNYLNEFKHKEIIRTTLETYSKAEVDEKMTALALKNITCRTFESQHDIFQAAYHNGIYLLGGPGDYYITTDLIHLQVGQTLIPGDSFKAISYSKLLNTFILGTHYGHIFTTKDGSNPVDQGELFTGGGIRGLFDCQGVLIGFGNIEIKKTTDAVSFEPILTLETSSLRDYAIALDKVIILSESGEIYKGDSQSFSLAGKINTVDSCRSIAYGNRSYIVGTTCGIYISQNLNSWTKVSDLKVNDILFHQGVFIAGAIDHIYYSQNGIDWTAVRLPVTPFNVFKVFYQEKYIFFGSPGKLFTSLNL